MTDTISFHGFPDMTEDQKAVWRKTIAWLEAGGDEQHKFNMDHWLLKGMRGQVSCGTVCCIGGFIDIITCPEWAEPEQRHWEELLPLIGIPSEHACRLFFSWGHDSSDTHAAAARIRVMLANGEIPPMGV